MTAGIPHHPVFFCSDIAFRSWDYFPTSPSFCVVLCTGFILRNSRRKQHFLSCSCTTKNGCKGQGFLQNRSDQSVVSPSARGNHWRDVTYSLPQHSGAGRGHHQLPFRKRNVALFWSLPVTAALSPRGTVLWGWGGDGTGHTRKCPAWAPPPSDDTPRQRPRGSNPRSPARRECDGKPRSPRPFLYNPPRARPRLCARSCRVTSGAARG